MPFLSQILACFACVAVFLAASAACCDSFAAELAARSDGEIPVEIDGAAIRRHTETLAADAFEGREAGKAGGRAAATYIRRALQKYRIATAGEGGAYFQSFGRGYRNILAVIPGASPELRNEYVILSAHYDHVGLGTKTNSNGGIGSIHNGADDNSSGVAAVLEVAKVLNEKTPLGRSVLVVFWDAEEKGLLGSKHWLEHPTVEPENVRYVVNVDMVGRLRERLFLYGTRTLPGMRLQWSLANQRTNMLLEFPWEVINNSDHYTFFQNRIPVAMVHTGLHDEYHRSSDDAHLLNQDGIVTVCELLVQFVHDIANRPELPGFRAASLAEKTAGRLYFERPFREQQRRLGLTVKPYEGELGKGLSVESVWLGSPASRANLQPGSLVLLANDIAMRSAADLRQQVGKATRALRLQIVEDGQRREVEVELADKPPRIGVSWRTNEAEPDVVMLSGVVPESPAAKSGCLPLDRVVKVDGEFLRGSTDFRQRMENASGLVELLLERDGRLLTVELVVPEKKVSGFGVGLEGDSE